MAEWTERAELLFKRRIDKLHNANVLIVGLGDCGIFTAEFLFHRAGGLQLNWRTKKNT
jgi:tRNA A37 threonylcarbamoyladenosine dehydratase